MGVFFINWITALEGPTRNLLLRTIIFIAYLIAGAAIFKALESGKSSAEKEEFRATKLQMKITYGINESVLEKFVEEVRKAVDDGYYDVNFDRWSFFGSLFFTATVITTIGFGHMAPRTFGGQFFCMVYAFFGIPITGLMLKSFGERFMDTIDMVVRAIDKKLLKKTEERSTMLRTSFILFAIMIAMILLLAGVSMQYEGWTFFEGIYFAFITLSTIGFGDFVPTAPHVDNKRGKHTHAHNHLHVVLFIFVTFVYITVGLAVVSSVLVSISRMFESKTQWDFISFLDAEEEEEEEEEVNDDPSQFLIDKK